MKTSEYNEIRQRQKLQQKILEKEQEKTTEDKQRQNLQEEILKKRKP